MAESLIIQYANLLHRYRDSSAKPVQEFVTKYSKDAAFLKRVAVLDRMFALKNQLVGEAGQSLDSCV